MSTEDSAVAVLDANAHGGGVTVTTEPLEPDASKEPAVALVEDTEESSHEGNDDGDSSFGYESEDDAHNKESTIMPLLKYTRLFGSLPRQPRQQGTATASPPLSVACTCSIMGKVLLTPDNTAVSEPLNNNNTNTGDHQPSVAMDLWRQQPIHVIASGYQDGRVLLVDAHSGVSIAADQDQLKVRDNRNQREAIVAVTLDSSGTHLAAIDAGGLVVIWELKYTVQLRSSNGTASGQVAAAASSSSSGQTSSGRATTGGEEQSNVFTSFMSAFTGAGGSDAANQSGVSSQEETHNVLVPTLTLASVQVSRITYPKSFGVPTCMVIDPAYKKRREKALLVGFNDGRLVLTKRGFVFQRRSDAVVYQAVASADKYFCGIEALVWRGSLVAWADSSGVRLLDADTLTRIAHVDRPTGARPTLYPTVSNMRPTLCFETSNKLLIAWGDCLMRLAIRESSVARQMNASGGSTGGSEVSAAGGSTATAVVRRRTVECTMAWELDCVACGVAPLDDEHVIVLGLVPPSDETDGEHPVQVGDGHHQNDVELQVVSRSDGAVVYSDLLPVLRQPTRSKKRGGGNDAESVANYSLLSSFNLPRMENVYEIRDDSSDVDDNFDPLQVSIFSSPETKRTFRDSHVRWSLKDTSFEDGAAGIPDKDEMSKSDLVSDTDSVDSDDYGFILRHQSMREEQKASIPPVMCISTGADVVLGTVRDVDDAVSFALASKKPGLALQRAMRHVRRLRKYKIDDLVNEYFRAVLRLPESETDEDAVSEEDASGMQVEIPHLSLRRMKLAAEAMPILLGGNNDLWQRWVSELEKIPGALFVVRSFLPVRDPFLPQELYSGVLRKMLQQIDAMKSSSDSDAVKRLAIEAEGHFLNTLIAWGTTETLREHVKLYEYQCQGNESSLPGLHAAEESLRRRSTQTAAGYLQFPSEPSAQEQLHEPSQLDDESPNSLFEVDDLLSYIAQRVDVLSEVSAVSTTEVSPLSTRKQMNSRIALDALAKLNMMTGQYDDALKCFLRIGVLHSLQSLDTMEDAAIALVNGGDVGKVPGNRAKVPYAYVISFIENHHLHQCLLTPTFLSNGASSSPLFALLQLVGLELAGQFLLEHCVAPQQKSAAADSSKDAAKRLKPQTTDKTDGERRGTLPLDLVVGLLESSPKLLHWYLNLVFIRKPAVYVTFPNTLNPPAVITALHRRHLELYIKYAGVNRDSAKVLEGVEAYRVGEKTTPLLSFLTIVLQLGGIRPREVGKTLEVERKGGAGVSRIFALELAHILEHYGDESEAEAWLILELYLKGAMSLMLAVAYAQRVQHHSSTLWKILINHCLAGTTKLSKNRSSADGSLFGSLLEAAALSGADLANLVAQIPPGMAIEGLRPRLVAAVADYRLKLVMTESSSAIALDEKIALLRERTHRSRRGMRCEPLEIIPWSMEEGAEQLVATVLEKDTPTATDAQLTSVRTKERNDRYSLSYSLPMR